MTHLYVLQWQVATSTQEENAVNRIKRTSGENVAADITRFHEDEDEVGSVSSVRGNVAFHTPYSSSGRYNLATYMLLNEMKR